MEEYALRFFIGGVAVSCFAALGDIFRPKSFAGLFGAAPSVAVATLGIAIWQHGPNYAAIEGRSMIIGLGFYGVLVCQLMKRYRYSAVFATGIALVGWITAAFGLKWLFLG
jgi:Protein of unknown function (DUF3147)